MAIELEITEEMIKEAVKKLSTKSFWGEGGLSKIIEEAVKIAATQYVRQQLKENNGLRTYLEIAIQESIKVSMQDAGKRIGEVIVDGIERGLANEFGDTYGG